MQPSPGKDRVPSHDHTPSTLTKLRQPGNEHGYHRDCFVPPRTMWKSPTPPTGRSLIGWGSYVIEPAPPGDDRLSSTAQRSFHISKLDKPGKKTDLSRVDTAPPGVETPIPLAKIADWFELHSSAAPP